MNNRYAVQRFLKGCAMQLDFMIRFIQEVLIPRNYLK